MRNKKVFLAILAMALLLIPALGRAEMYVGIYGGPNFIDNTTVTFTPTSGPGTILGPSTAHDVKMDPAVIGGLTVGYWFTRQGFLGYNYPDWMKYLGFAVDFSYHRMDVRVQQVRWTPPTIGTTLYDTGTDEGYAATLAFMFVGRYGFLPDSEVPFGRLQPYIAVGPAVFFSGQSSDDMGSASSTDVALVVESGIRYMALKNVSINLAFRYRYVRPTYTYNGIILGSVTQTQTFNLFNAILGVSYHF